MFVIKEKTMDEILAPKTLAGNGYSAQTSSTPYPLMGSPSKTI
jgi:hypothetical protein